MIQVTCISGDTEYVAAELSSKLSGGWEIISVETSIFERQGNLSKETTVYLKKISE